MWRKTQTSDEMRERGKKEEKYTVRKGNTIKEIKKDKNNAGFLRIILIHVICCIKKNGASDSLRKREMCWILFSANLSFAFEVS